MELLTKLEKTVFGWFKSVPDLPTEARKWLGDNAWWIVIVGTVLAVMSILGSLATLNTRVSLLDTVAASYYVSSAASTWIIVTDIVALAFLVLQTLLLVIAIQPLKEKQKKGWVLLFAAWLISAVALIVNAMLGLSVINFIISVLFGAIWVAVTGYFLFEIHGQFAHVERSKGVKKAK
jgi:FtsH-binding integral membrane protein